MENVYCKKKVGPKAHLFVPYENNQMWGYLSILALTNITSRAWHIVTLFR